MSLAAGTSTAGSSPLVFITGASSGMGQALALQYYQQGWRLALVARRVSQMQDWMMQHAIDPARCQLFPADVSQPDSIGFLLPSMTKDQLFPTVIFDGALPRKTFSMGEAHDKRFYMEARKIK